MVWPKTASAGSEKGLSLLCASLVKEKLFFLKKKYLLKELPSEGNKEELVRSFSFIYGTVDVRETGKIAFRMKLFH